MGNAASGRQISIELVQRIQRLLKDRGPCEVAEEVGVDWGTVKKIERGEHPQQAVLRSCRRCPGCGGKLKGGYCLKCDLEGNPEGLGVVPFVARTGGPVRGGRGPSDKPDRRAA